MRRGGGLMGKKVPKGGLEFRVGSSRDRERGITGGRMK